MVWLYDLVGTLPRGWEITFHHVPDVPGPGLEVVVVGWFPHAPETSGERRTCERCEMSQLVSADEMNGARGDIVRHTTEALVRKVQYEVGNRFDNPERAKGGRI